MNRFWSKVDKRGPDDCWRWLAARDEKGYGRFGVDGRNTKATHSALRLDGRPRPTPTAVARHSCDNPSCVNPRHLSWGSQADNVEDAVQRERMRNGGIRGQAHANAKLSEEDVRIIRSSAEPQRRLAARFGVCQQLISQVQRGEGWAHIA